MIEVAEACLGHKFEKEPMIIGTSGRYEFRNKGLDIFMESLKRLAMSDKLEREVLVYITVPAANTGARADLQAHLQDKNNPIDLSQYKYSTHRLEYLQNDQVVNALNGSILTTEQSKPMLTVLTAKPGMVTVLSNAGLSVTVMIITCLVP